MLAKMGRREFIAALGSSLARPLTVHAEQQAMPTIGIIGGQVKLLGNFLANVRKGLAEQGYVEGQNFRFDLRENNFQVERNPTIFREMVDQKVTVLVIYSTAHLALAKAATQSIPIVFTIAGDPVENGFVASLNKPGGNITGVFNLGSTMTGKRLEVIHELLPSITKFAFLTDPGNQTLGTLQTRNIQVAADLLGFSLVRVNAHTPDEIDNAVETAVRSGVGGMIVGADALFSGASVQLVAAAARYRLPTIYVDDIVVKSGGLMNYGVDQDDNQRLVGNYVGRVLKGEKPADIPVQQTTKTKFVINLKTAKALGITVPISLLARADEVIE